jgi:hypothetical protein
MRVGDPAPGGREEHREGTAPLLGTLPDGMREPTAEDVREYL